jgi:hypothetical protein
MWITILTFRICPCVHCKENLIYVFIFWELLGLSPNFQNSCVCERCIFPRSVHIFPSAEYIGWSIVGIYKSLTDTWMWKLGLWPCIFFSGNISILFLCSVEHKIIFFSPIHVYVYVYVYVWIRRNYREANSILNSAVLFYKRYHVLLPYYFSFALYKMCLYM